MRWKRLVYRRSGSLSSVALEELVRECEIWRYAAGETIMREGYACLSICLPIHAFAWPCASSFRSLSRAPLH